MSKDVRYAALAFNNSSTVDNMTEGLVVIYDLVKGKVSSRFGTPVSELGVERGLCPLCWRLVGK